VDEAGVFHLIPSLVDSRLQVMVRYYGLYANAHRGKVKKASLSVLRIVEEELRRLPCSSIFFFSFFLSFLHYVINILLFSVGITLCPIFAITSPQLAI